MRWQNSKDVISVLWSRADTDEKNILCNMEKYQTRV